MNSAKLLRISFLQNISVRLVLMLQLLTKHSSNSSEICNSIKKEALTQVFSSEFCEVSKNTFSYRTPPVAASGDIRFKLAFNPFHATILFL